MSPANSGPDCFRSRGRETNISSAGQTGYWGAGAVEENGLAFTRLANSYSTLMLCRNVLAVPFNTPSLKEVIPGMKKRILETLIFLRDSPRLSGINKF